MKSVICFFIRENCITALILDFNCMFTPLFLVYMFAPCFESRLRRLPSFLNAVSCELWMSKIRRKMVVKENRWEMTCVPLHLGIFNYLALLARVN
jgi:hypothetical protein